MRVLVMVKASQASEAGTMPDGELLGAMGRFNEELAKARPSKSSYAAALGTEYIAPPKIAGRDIYLLREPTKGRWHVWDGHNGVFDQTTYDMEDITGSNGCYKAAAVREMGIGTLTREIIKKDANGPYPTREPRRTGEILAAVGASLGNTANSFSADYTLDRPCVLTSVSIHGSVPSRAWSSTNGPTHCQAARTTCAIG